MSDAARVPVVLHHAGYTYDEIAAIVGCTSEAARKRVARATEELRTSLAR
jgi:DNA-directed RNA polymerase specialized sigma24 family protein